MCHVKALCNYFVHNYTVFFFKVKLEFALCHFIPFATHWPARSTPPVSTSAFITAVLLVLKSSGPQL